MKKQIEESVLDSIRAVSFLQTQEAIDFIEKSANLISNCYKADGKLIIAGNGGSLCDASHFAEEMTGYFRSPRKALPAIVLSEPGHLTCVANDKGFDYVFSRGVEAFGKKEDIFIGLTTSGNSENVSQAFRAAKERGMKTIAFLGKTGGSLKGVADCELLVSGFSTSDRIQEAHMAAIHIIIEMVEQLLFSNLPHAISYATVT